MGKGWIDNPRFTAAVVDVMVVLTPVLAVPLYESCLSHCHHCTDNHHGHHAVHLLVIEDNISNILVCNDESMKSQEKRKQDTLVHYNNNLHFYIMCVMRVCAFVINFVI